MNYINLDFCIIENPLDKNKRPIIFVTRKGRQYLDETVINEDDYEKAIFAIQDIGYVESDILTFESSQDPDFPSVALNDIKKMLEEKGMKYSLELEETMKSEFELFNINGAKQFINNLSTESEANKEKKNYITPEQMFLYNKKSRYKIPEIGEKLTLYFHLFVECRFSGEKCYLNLNGDFTSSENNELRNYLGAFRCDFIRINNVNNPNKIVLKSCKTNKDILKKLPMDYGGSFNLKIKENNKLIDKLFVYYLMEVKNNFPLENRITIEIDSSYNFEQMIKMSKKIKTKYELVMKKNYPTTQLLDSFTKMIGVLNSKMFAFADNDEFEKAARIKIDIKYIENKIKKINKIKEGSILYGEFLKNFHVN
jgi:hypothetical protein